MGLPTFVLPPHLAGDGWINLLHKSGMSVRLGESFEGMGKDHYGYTIEFESSVLQCIHVPYWPVSKSSGADKADHLVIVPLQSLARDKLYEQVKDVLMSAGAVMK